MELKEDKLETISVNDLIKIAKNLESEVAVLRLRIDKLQEVSDAGYEIAREILSSINTKTDNKASSQEITVEQVISTISATLKDPTFIKMREDFIGKRFDEPQRMNGWISVDDRLPDQDALVLVCNNFFNYCSISTLNHPFTVFKDSNNKVSNEWSALITHWMPLPALPSGKA